MNEDKFLRAREEREEKKKHRDGPSDDTEARTQFVHELDAAHLKIERLLSDDGATDEEKKTRCEAAHKTWLGLQDVIKCASDVLKLPPHELRTANRLLSSLIGKIEGQRKELRGGPKGFKFSSRVKLVGKPTRFIEDDHENAAGPSSSTQAADAATAKEDENIISNRHDATLYITSRKAIFVRHCKNCTVLMLPVAGSVFLEHLEDCIVYTSSHQLRMKNCKRVQIYTCCRSTPIIEACREVQFGPYSAWTGLLQSEVPPSLAGSSLSTVEDWVSQVGDIQNFEIHARDSYKKIDDFDWLRQQQSPHWCVLSDEAGVRKEEQGTFVYPQDGHACLEVKK